MSQVIALVTALIASALCMKFLAIPYLWIGLIWASFGFFVFFKQRNQTVKVVLAHLSLIALVFSGVELYFYKQLQSHIQASGDMWQHDKFVKDDIKGYAPRKNITAYGKKTYDGAIIYDVSYSTDKDGLRVTPKHEIAKQSVLFFGCSITFGDGLDDEVTLPYLVGQQLPEVNTYNFGYSGYGPHQMLSALEKDHIPSVVNEDPAVAIYSAIPGHILRSAGLQSWIVTDHDPKYVLDQDNLVSFAGYYDDEQNTSSIWARRFRAYLSNSYIFKKIHKPFAYNIKRIQTEQDLALYTAIVTKSAKVFKQKYPNGEFHVLLWKLLDPINTADVYDKMLAEFKAQNIKVHEVHNILPGFYQNHPKYQIVHDSHPTPWANKLLADYVVNEIISKQLGQDAS